MSLGTVFFDPERVDDRFLNRFWSKVDRRGPDECWPWTSSLKPPGGYGMFWLGSGKSTTANRVALALTLGRPLKNNESACHTCDNPPCCNPAHLFAGTQSDNNFDCISKGRFNAPRGESQNKAVLTEEQVREIRATPPKWGLDLELARRYGVTKATIRSARLGISWKHVA